MKIRICSVLMAILSVSFSQTFDISGDGTRLSPRLLNYQGYLTDTLGNPITNPGISMTFSIFDAASVGNQKWTEIQASVSVDKGIFHVLLGSETPIPDSVFNNTNRWLEVTVAGQTLSPRTRIVSSAYSYTSTYSDTAAYARNAAGGNAWSFRITDGADTTLQTSGRWGLARAGNAAFGNADSTHVNFGAACTTGRSGYNDTYCTVSGGYINKTRGSLSTVGGGAGNITSEYATVAGGLSNYAGPNGSVGGGLGNSAGNYSSVGGGYNNAANRVMTTVGGGYYNCVEGAYSAILGGYGDTITGTGDYSYLFGISSKLTQASTFMVDMPHIRFGKESNGYEFPTIDGVNGQVMITNGAGQLSWSSAPSDIDWSFRITDGADTTLQTGGPWGLARAGNVAFGNADSTHVNWGVACTTGTNGQNYKYSSVSGGFLNSASNVAATVGGGVQNSVGGQYAMVGGGFANNARGDGATVGGGWSNTASGNFAIVGGGYNNSADSNYATVAGGEGNKALSLHATVAGGYANTIHSFYNTPTYNSAYATVGGGYADTIENSAYAIVNGGYRNLVVTSPYTTVIGGQMNYSALCWNGVVGGYSDTITGYCSGIFSGFGNRAADSAAVVAGGGNNSAGAKYAAIGGGSSNIANGIYSTVAGGDYNQADSSSSAVGGGSYNIARAWNATVGGGGWNIVDRNYSTIAGGYYNTCGSIYGYPDDELMTVGGGGWNTASGQGATVGGGYENVCYGDFSTITGGHCDTVYGDYSYLFGIGSTLYQDSTFMVNMPHVRFGDEANGYEFPINDGTPGQVMVTNGAGQMGWGSAPSAVNHWYLRITDGADTTLETIGRWGLSRRGSVSLGNSDSTHVNFGVACTTGNQKYATIGGGYANTAMGLGSTVCGGWQNHSTGDASFIGGGSNNSATNGGAVVAGGQNNTANHYGTMVGGGWSNQAGGDGAAVCGGAVDSAKGYYSCIGGGAYNKALGSSSAVSGGWLNTANETYGFVGGGYANSAYSYACGVLSGYGNNAGNDLSDSFAVVSGGYGNRAIAKHSFVGGGYADTASGSYAVVTGGWSNIADDYCSTVGGGENNFASGNGSVVSGGGYNLASGSYSAVAGGVYDTSAAAYSFTAGYRSRVPGGYNNSAAFNGLAATASTQLRCGTLAKTGGTFTIDHPLDPENKILNHYFVESPEMVLIYRGSAVIGENGRATVHLPDYFNALNKNPMIQLTGVKSNDVWVEEEVAQNTFMIGGKPGVKVYWTVTGERKDPSADVIKIIMPVEQLKEGDLTGRSLDDDFLVSALAQLERMGKADGFKFRHASEQKRYEEMKQMTEGSK